MLSQDNKYINEASETIYQLTQEERIWLQCEAREDYYRRQRSVQAHTAELTATVQKQDETIRELTATIEKQAATNAELMAAIATLKAALEANGIIIDC